MYNLWTQVTEKSIDGRTPIYDTCAQKLSKNYDIRFENTLFTFGFFIDFLALIAMAAYVEDEVLTTKNNYFDLASFSEGNSARISRTPVRADGIISWIFKF